MVINSCIYCKLSYSASYHYWLVNQDVLAILLIIFIKESISMLCMLDILIINILASM